MKMGHLDVENNCSFGPAPTTENHELEFEASSPFPEKRASVSQVNDRHGRLWANEKTASKTTLEIRPASDTMG